jgi:branched-chain amino acid aminotransferase
MTVFLNHKFVDLCDAQISVRDHGFLYGDGIYETLRTVGGRFLFLEEHLRRFFSSLEKMGIGISQDFDGLQRILVEGVRRSNSLNLRIRITATRGENDFEFQQKGMGTLVVLFEEIGFGVIDERSFRLKTVELVRNLPEIKSVSMVGSILARAALGKDFDEVLFVNEGRILEGSITNFFAVKHGVLKTADSQILPGICRGKILEICEKNNISVNLEALGVDEICDFEEAFVCNSVRGIISVSQIDSQQISGGKLGRLTKFLQQEFLKICNG